MQGTSRNPKRKDTLMRHASVYVSRLNPLYQRNIGPNDDPIIECLVPEESVRDNFVSLQLDRPPFIETNGIRWFWVLVHIGNTSYLVNRRMCFRTNQDAPGVYRFHVPTAFKVVQLDETSDRIELDQMNNAYATLKDDFTKINDEMTTIKEELATAREELKRKRDEDEQQQPEIEQTASEMKKCDTCEKELPIKSYITSCKKTNKLGGIMTYVSTRRTCYKCRYANGKQKKAKTVQ